MGNGKDSEDQNYVVLRSDRRKNLRRQLLVLKVKAEDQKGVFFGYAKTLSRGGMFIASVNPRRLGEEFYITFRLPGDNIDIRCRAVVAWVREFDPGKLNEEPGMGIKFVDLNEDVRDKINEWIKTGKA